MVVGGLVGSCPAISKISSVQVYPRLNQHLTHLQVETVRVGPCTCSRKEITDHCYRYTGGGPCVKVYVEPFTCSNDGVHEKCDPSLCCEVDVQLGVLSQQGLQSTHITRVTCFHHTLHQWVGGGHDEGGVLKVVCRTKVYSVDTLLQYIRFIASHKLAIYIPLTTTAVVSEYLVTSTHVQEIKYM